MVVVPVPEPTQEGRNDREARNHRKKTRGRPNQDGSAKLSAYMQKDGNTRARHGMGRTGVHRRAKQSKKKREQKRRGGARKRGVSIDWKTSLPNERRGGSEVEKKKKYLQKKI